MSPQPKRSTETEPGARKARIADAAIQLLATGGLRAVTHRDVARVAQVSLAATTYYYSSKDEILQLASRRLLDSYTDAVRRAAREIQRGRRHEPDFRSFVRRLLWAGAGRNREVTLAWCEVMLELAREPEGQATARAWYAAFEAVLAEVADAIGVADPGPVVQSAIHTTAGLMLMTVSLRLEPQALTDVLDRVTDPLAAWAPPDGGEDEAPARSGAKAERTREAILDAAVEILAGDGATALSYRTLSERTGLTTSAPAYHFASIERIVSLALGRLLDAAGKRLVETFEAAGPPGDLEAVLARMIAHLQVEAGPQRREALAAFVSWTHASRDPGLRHQAWRALGEASRMWTTVLAGAGYRVSPLDALLCHAMLTGRLVRLVAIGARPDEVTASAAGLRWELAAITGQRSYI